MRMNFKFENMWTEHNDCEKVIKESWLGENVSIEDQIVNRIQRCGEAFLN